MKTLVVVLLTIISTRLAAQEKKYNFQTGVQVGLLEGAAGSAFQLQAINGFRYKTWSVGIGAGLEYYHARTIPVFLDIRKALSRSDKTPFVYVDGGYNFPWLRSQDKQWDWWNNEEGKGGLYFDAGVGYQLPVMKTSALYFSAGYSVKEYSVKSYSGAVIAIFPPPSPLLYTYDYTLRRISMKTGLRF